MQQLFVIVVLGAILLPCRSAQAETPSAAAPLAPASAAFVEKWKNATTQELTDALNRCAHESIQQSHQVESEERKLREAWRDPAYATEEIKALRIRLQELENEFLEVRKALREAVAKVPEFKARRDAVDRQRLSIESLVQEREVVQNLLRQREQDQ